MPVRRKACPDCRVRGRDRSGDNLAVYSDGHEYCYSCGRWTPPTVRARLTYKEPAVAKPGLPADFSRQLSPEASAWLHQYGILASEIDKYGIGWSGSKQLLIFPVYGVDGEVLAWQGRNFALKLRPPKAGETLTESQKRAGGIWDTDGPKYLTFGPVRDILYVLDSGTFQFKDTIVLVEGVVDAIKVARRAPAMPLFGSYVAPETIRRLSARFSRVGIWLDSDKTGEAVKSAIRASQYMPAFVIRTDGDPKEHHTDQITAVVQEAEKQLVN